MLWNSAKVKLKLETMLKQENQRGDFYESIVPWLFPYRKSNHLSNLQIGNNLRNWCSSHRPCLFPFFLKHSSKIITRGEWYNVKKFKLAVLSKGELLLLVSPLNNPKQMSYNLYYPQNYHRRYKAYHPQHKLNLFELQHHTTNL